MAIMRNIKHLIKYGLLILFLLICQELMLYAHSFVRFDSKMVYLPNSKSGCTPNPKYLPGISGASYFTTNSLGLRGPEPQKNHRFGVAIGNSTTKNSWLDDTETWPQLLMDLYNKDCEKPVVINTGAHGGLTPRHMRLITENLVNSPNKPDFILWLADISNLEMLINQAPSYTGLDTSDEHKAFRTGVYFPGHLPKDKDETLLYQYYEKMEKKINLGFDSVFGTVADSKRNGEKEYKKRQISNDSKLEIWEKIPKDILKSKHLALSDFNAQVIEVINLCQQNDIKLFLITQPLNYKPKMSKEETELYTEKIYNNKRIPAQMYDEMFLWFIEELEDISKTYGIDLIPLRSEFQKIDNSFIDSCHFNEKGSLETAVFINNYLKNTHQSF